MLEELISKYNITKDEKILYEIGREYVNIVKDIDYREQDKLIRIAKELGFKVEALKMGDISSSDIIAIEHKSIDFFDSVFTGRIFQQLHEIKENFKYSFLVVDMSYEELINRASERGISKFNVISTIASLMLRGFPPVFIKKDDYVLLSELLITKAADNKNREIYNPIRRKATSSEYKVNILSAFPSISNKTARAIVNWFGNINECINSFYWLGLLDYSERYAIGIKSTNIDFDDIIRIIEI